MSSPQVISTFRRKMLNLPQGAKTLLPFLLFIVVIAYTYYAKSYNSHQLVKVQSRTEIVQNVLTEDGAWCWFADPRAIYHKGSKYTRTFIGWVTSQGDIMIGGFDHNTLETLPEVTIKSKFQKDDHANPSLLILDDGHIVIFYSAHCGSKMFFKVSKFSESIVMWGKEQTVNTNVEGQKGYTYPRPFLLQQGEESSRIVLMWRGGTWKPTMSEVADKDTWDWKPSTTIISGQGARPYIKYIDSYNEDTPRIHMAFTDGHPRNEPTNSIYYAFIENSHMYRADGTSITTLLDLPMEPYQAHLVYDAKKSAGGKAWIWDIAIDQFDYPVLVYVRFPDDTDHRYHYARWNGDTWIDRELVRSGSWCPETPEGKTEPEPNYSGGIFLDHSDPNRVVLSRQVGNIFEIEMWTTKNNGETWMTKKITSKSSYHNIRPIIPFGYKSGKNEKEFVLWITGMYEHFTKYKTSIKYAFV